MFALNEAIASLGDPDDMMGGMFMGLLMMLLLMLVIAAVAIMIEAAVYCWLLRLSFTRATLVSAVANVFGFMGGILLGPAISSTSMYWLYATGLGLLIKVAAVAYLASTWGDDRGQTCQTRFKRAAVVCMLVNLIAILTAIGVLEIWNGVGT